jgi:hypothetical protein
MPQDNITIAAGATPFPAGMFYFGSGAPSFSAPKGALYVRSDGSSASTRIYVNSTGSTTWVSVTTAS